MAGERFIQIDTNGRLAEKTASQAGGAGAENLIPALDATGRLATSMLPVGVGADTKQLPASEDLAAGDLVNIWSDGGTAKARKADASASGKEAVGFVLAAVTNGQTATVYFEGTITGLSGLTPGTRMFLSATAAGGASAVVPTTAGQVVQLIGRAVSASEISFEPGEPVVRA